MRRRPSRQRHRRPPAWTDAPYTIERATPLTCAGVVLWAVALCAGAGLGVSCRGTAEATASASVPFETSHSQILVPVRIGDAAAPYWFLLDTGVDPSVIDESLLDLEEVLELGVESGKAEGAGEDEGLDVRAARLSRYSVGGLGFTDLEAVAADLSGFGATLGRPLAGILGYSFLKDKTVRIDYAQRRIDLAFGRASLPDGGGRPARQYSVPLRFMNDEDLIPVVDLGVNGLPGGVAGGTIRVTLDTGSSLGVQFYGSAVDRLGLRRLADEGETSSIAGARGRAAIRNATMNGIVLGPFEEAVVPVSFSDRAHDPTERQGNVGNRFLERFVVTLDYVEGVILFERPEPAR